MEIERLNEISSSIVQSAIEIHRTIGPGLLESVYRSCLIYELRLDGAYRIDLLVEDSVIVELKSVEALLPVHHAQVLSYLRLTNRRLGLLINFNVPYLVKGVRRIINGF